MKFLQYIKFNWHFSIPQKILSSFIFLLCISFALTAFNIFGMQVFNQHFHHFNSVSKDTNLMLRIDTEVSDLQRHILAFSNTEKGSTSKQLYMLRKQLSSDINQLIHTSSNNTTNITTLLLQMNLAVNSFSEKINSLETERTYRETLVNRDLGALFDESNNQLNKIFIRSESDVSTTKKLWSAQHNLFLAEKLSGRYFARREFQLRQSVKEAITVTSTTIESIMKKNQSVEYRKDEIQMLDLLEKTSLLFNKAVQADRNYLFLVNVVIAGETSELSNLSESLKSSMLIEQNEIFSATEHQISWNQKFNFVISIISAIIALIAAIIIGKRISNPLQSITRTFSRLVSGEDLQEIPGMNRTDEIGKLALAANSFREANVKTQELLDKTKKLAEDLTQREQALELSANNAQEANLAKSQFLANMSHELRTPMNAILGMLSLLQKTALNARQTDYVMKTEGAARSLLSLLNDILDLTKAEAGKIELDPIPFDLEHLFRDLHVILSTNLTAKPVELNFSIGKGVPLFLLGDSLRLQQILINLGGNAIKFTPQGTVDISVAYISNNSNQFLLKFNVQDTGIGIAEEGQEKIFNNFTQAEASITRRFGGTGLGLAISQRLVMLMGGELTLQSQLGKGSNFSFCIELPALEQNEIANLTNKQKITSKLKGIKCLENMWRIQPRSA